MVGRRIRHVNVGSFQLLWWPRRRLWFWRGPTHYLAYQWILYLWPFEVRRFRKLGFAPRLVKRSS
jgi:hypothetical protein